MIADKYLDKWDAASEHNINIHGDAAVIYAAARELDFSKSWIIRFLFALRGLPARNAGLASLDKIGFKMLEEQPPDEFVIGIVGRFWTPGGHLIATTPQEFITFTEPGFARATWSFRIEKAEDGQKTLYTFTRVRCTDSKSRRSFLRYWRFIGPFSGLIRREILSLIKTSVEKTLTAPVAEK